MAQIHLQPPATVLRLSIAGIIGLTSALFFSGANQPAANAPLDPVPAPAAQTEAEAIRAYSYMLGRIKSQEFTSFDIDIKPDAYREGLTDSLQRKPSKFTDQVIDENLSRMQSRLNEQSGRQQDVYRRLGVELLEKNAKDKDVKITPSGLHYKVIAPGDGHRFQDGNVVLLDYVLETNAGQRAPLSPGANSPIRFQVGDAYIKGLDEALRLMSPGAVLEVKIPPALAFGPRRAGSFAPDTVLSMKLTALSLLEANGNQPKPQPAARPSAPSR